MAQNVKFIKGDTAKINGTAITDGQLLYDTTTGQHYIDNESTRVEVGKPVVNTMAEVSAITVDNISCGTKPVKELITNLNVVVCDVTTTMANVGIKAFKNGLMCSVSCSFQLTGVSTINAHTPIHVATINGWTKEIEFIIVGATNSDVLIGKLDALGLFTVTAHKNDTNVGQWFYGGITSL